MGPSLFEEAGVLETFEPDEGSLCGSRKGAAKAFRTVLGFGLGPSIYGASRYHRITIGCFVWSCIVELGGPLQCCTIIDRRLQQLVASIDIALLWLRYSSPKSVAGGMSPLGRPRSLRFQCQG